MASFVFGNALESAINGSSPDWDTDTIRAALMLSSYSENKEETSMTTPRSSVASGAADQTITAIAASAASGTVTCDAGNPTFATVDTAQTVDAIIVFSFITNDAGSIPWSHNEFTSLATNGSDVQVTIAAAGVFTIAY